MKLTTSCIILLMAALWLSLAQTNVSIALKCSGDERATHLSRAREDAKRFRTYTAIWFSSMDPRFT